MDERVSMLRRTIVMSQHNPPGSVSPTATQAAVPTATPAAGPTAAPAAAPAVPIQPDARSAADATETVDDTTLPIGTAGGPPPVEPPTTESAEGQSEPAPAAGPRNDESVTETPPAGPITAAEQPATPAATEPLLVGSPSVAGHRRRLNRTVLLVVTSAVAVILVLITAGLAYAFVDRDHAYRHQRDLVRQRDATISTNINQISRLKAQLTAAQADNARLQQQAADQGSQVTELQTEKTVLGTCITSINDFFGIVGENGSPAAQTAASTKMESDCAAAQKYLK
jgi:hypothetical protein